MVVDRGRGSAVTVDREIAALERQAEELAGLGEWGTTAETVNRRLVELAPRQVAGYTRLARCLKERGDNAGAEALYRRVLEIEPTNVIANNNLARLRAEREAASRAGQATPAKTNPAATSRRGATATSRTLPDGRTGSAGGPGDGALSFLHQRLERHFTRLQERRHMDGGGAPIFALEHGLPEAELTLLRAEVCAAVRRRNLPRDSWLPFVVYASEIGYEYSGDEYWQTFEARTPHWVENGDRHYMRAKFRQFKDQFRGAQPTGPWATQFSIICWPITHAVLPTDLQRHLARLLFEYRRALTSDLLDDPAELGARLAARSWQTSSRFQNFAQNTDLLGQVAVALYREDEDSPYLLDSTLRRIVADLSKEQETWRLLRGAKSWATQVRTRGFRPDDRKPSDRSGSGTGVRLPSAADPELSLRKEGAAWIAYLEVPDLSALAERLPAVYEEAERLRAKVVGVSGAPLARGRLLRPGQQLPLAEWPLSAGSRQGATSRNRRDDHPSAGEARTASRDTPGHPRTSCGPASR